MLPPIESADDCGHQRPEKPPPFLLCLVEVSVADVVGLPNWLRGFDSRRPLCWQQLRRCN